MYTDKALQDYNNAIENAIEEYLEFELHYAVLYGNVIDILKKYNLLNKEGIKDFITGLNIQDKAFVKYLNNAIK